MTSCCTHQDDDHDAEEWERYEAFHDDVDKQVKPDSHKLKFWDLLFVFIGWHRLFLTLPCLRLYLVSGSCLWEPASIICCAKGRTKERLFEEELEVVWEKGGSGLVFYTDASHWDQQEGGNGAV